jgi:hypothetical protein
VIAISKACPIIANINIDHHWGRYRGGAKPAVIHWNSKNTGVQSVRRRQAALRYGDTKEKSPALPGF